MKNIISTTILTLTLSLFILMNTGCTTTTYKYIHPKYTKIKTVAKIPPVTVIIDKNNQATPESTTSLVNTVKAYKIKENYYDTEIYNWNALADKKNAEASKHNAKLEKERGDTYGLDGIFGR